MLRPFKEIEPQLKYLNRQQQYKLLLETTEWQQFRERILLRDSYHCTSCNKRQGEVIQVEVMTEEEWKKEVDRISLNNLERKKEYRKGMDYLNENPDKLSIEEICDKIIDLMVATGQKTIPLRFWDIGNIILQAHHKLYIYEKLPWEYKLENLTTLCSTCHSNVHKTEKIVMYRDTSFKEHQELTVCPRCNGAGYFEIYKHVNHGVCFQCGGAGVEFNQSPIWKTI